MDHDQGAGMAVGDKAADTSRDRASRTQIVTPPGDQVSPASVSPLMRTVGSDPAASEILHIPPHWVILRHDSADGQPVEHPSLPGSQSDGLGH